MITETYAFVQRYSFYSESNRHGFETMKHPMTQRKIEATFFFVKILQECLEQKGFYFSSSSSPPYYSFVFLGVGSCSDNDGLVVSDDDGSASSCCVDGEDEEVSLDGGFSC